MKESIKKLVYVALSSMDSSGSSDEDLDGEDWCVVCKGDNKIDRTPSLESDLCGHK
jgi:hypothetical protein